MSTEQVFKSGFIALIGRPNAGKSTLINHLVGTKVAICSDKPQTTRNTIRGVYHGPHMQAVFMDTPGVHKPKFKLGEQMMQAVNEAIAGCDLVFYLVDVEQRFGEGEKYIINLLRRSKQPVFLLLNKIDRLPKDQLLPLIAFYSQQMQWQEIVPCSALTGENTELLLDLAYQALPPGPRYYPEDMVSDYPETMLVAELVREQALRLTTDEVPHSIAVTVPAMEERANGLLYIEAILYVERDSQKGIIIGKQGSMLKKIGQAARQEIERIFGCRVYLDVRVRAKKDWRNNQGLLESWENMQ